MLTVLENDAGEASEEMRREAQEKRWDTEKLRRNDEKRHRDPDRRRRFSLSDDEEIHG